MFASLYDPIFPSQFVSGHWSCAISHCSGQFRGYRKPSCAYEQTVLIAIEETENALVRLSRALAAQAILEQAVETSRSAALTARQQFEEGIAGVLEVLDVERFD